MAFVTVKGAFKIASDGAESSISVKRLRSSDEFLQPDSNPGLAGSLRRKLPWWQKLITNADCSPLDRNRPVILKLLDILGMQLLCKYSRGDYEVVYWRFAPMMLSLLCLVSLIVYYFVASWRLKFEQWTLLLSYIAALSYCIFVICLGFVMRNKYCTLLTSLSFSNNRQWFGHPYILSVLFTLYGLVHILLNGLVDGQYQHITIYWDTVASAISNPFFPALLDLQLFWILEAISNVHDHVFSVIIRLIEARETCMGDPLLFPEFSGREEVRPMRKSLTVEEINRLCLGASHLVDQFNSISSGQLLFRCSIVLMKIIVFGFLITRHTIKEVCLLLFHVVDEAIRFIIICSAADRLGEKHRKMTDALWKLGSLTQTSREEKLLAALTSRLSARPVQISVGGFGVLGKHLLGNYLNIAVTYSVILYQSVSDQ